MRIVGVKKCSSPLRETRSREEPWVGVQGKSECFGGGGLSVIKSQNYDIVIAHVSEELRRGEVERIERAN